ncbi:MULTISPECIES: NAD-dependent epimerase/dehydratase family protein [Halomicrobium]|uniref:NAD-dependent epimerase/dehydratase n=2 Tax=Halomicrobium mukohataei TaxID=57705 RepID=C7NXU4_HALMD|nr:MULTISPECIES: NAD(P)H-binding protein [Halomicrobium]ACV46532.1 NAD-dependent epimerase/dehydratase [Halomicrobium mukohataei DSM 12286]QCD65075.1 NAD-dependent epimerase/dehydratase family protein [Halomicrobium mukohataei]QFR19881.1 NAD(P)H-binding protein [Halomicrobium sp. ZPS1]
MDVFIAGATGDLGKRLVEQFTANDHTVVGLTRDEEGDEIVRERGGQPHRGDLFDVDSLVSGATGADVVIHAATAIPTETKPSPADWEQNDRIRREGVENLTTAAAEVDADQYVQQSIVWVARQPDGSPFDETAPRNTDRTTESAADAEDIATTAARDGPFDATVLRCGWFYAADSEQTRTIAENLESGDMPIVGGGLFGRKDAVVSPIHIDDAANAFVAAAEDGLEGTYHVVDDEPVTVADFLTTFAEHLDAGEPSRIPGWLAKLFVGKDNVRFFTSSMPTSNEQFREATDWVPTYSTHEDGLAAVADNLS